MFKVLSSSDSSMIAVSDFLFSVAFCQSVYRLINEPYSEWSLCYRHTLPFVSEIPNSQNMVSVLDSSGCSAEVISTKQRVSWKWALMTEAGWSPSPSSKKFIQEDSQKSSQKILLSSFGKILLKRHHPHFGLYPIPAEVSSFFHLKSACFDVYVSTCMFSEFSGNICLNNFVFKSL